MKMFDRDYVERELRKLAKFLNMEAEIFVLGGAAMSFQNLKDATKDIDIVVRTPREYIALINGLKKCSYDEVIARAPYDTMEASAILENPDGFRWDIFVQRVCRGLLLSEGMIRRSTSMYEVGKLAVRAVSSEDIFIFKSITSRERDREDMNTLFRHDLDFDVIREEIARQSGASKDKAWLAFFFIGIEELKKKYDLVIPYFDEFHDMACEEVLRYILLDFLKVPRTVREMQKRTGENEPVIRKILRHLVKEGEVIKEKDRYAAKK